MNCSFENIHHCSILIFCVNNSGKTIQHSAWHHRERKFQQETFVVKILFKYKTKMSLSIIITASFIPSHPSINMITNVMDSLKLIGLHGDERIILAHDFNANPKFKQYLDNLNFSITNPNCVITTRTSHGHLTGNIRNAFDHVDSEYVLIIQHDLPFVEKFDI